MIAIVYERYGPPEVLQMAEMPDPVPGNKELLVKVYAATVNRTDCAILRAKPFVMRFVTGLLKPARSIPGTEFAGIIEAAGKDVGSFKAGDRIFGFDDTGLSSLAGYMTIAEDRALAIIAGNLSYNHAAAISEGAHYAFNFINKVNIKGGDNILVNGATGSIGLATLQFVKYLGANVTAVGNTKNLELLKSLGADRVIDYTQEDFTKDEHKYDFVFDAVGKSTFGRCRSLLNPGGVYISTELGPMAQNLFYSIVTPLTARLPGTKGKKVIFPFPSDIKRSILFVKKLVEERKFTAVIDRVYPLEKVPEAFRYVETGEKTGTVVISLALADAPA